MLAQFRLALARGDLGVAAASTFQALGEDAVERFGDLGDPLAHEVMEAACRHDGEDRFLGLFRLFLVGESKQPFGRGENTPGGVLGGRADRRELAQRVHQHGDLVGDRAATIDS